MTLCVCGHLRTQHFQHDAGVGCLPRSGSCSCHEYRKTAPKDRPLSAGVTPEGLAGETVAESVKVTPPTDEARCQHDDAGVVCGRHLEQGECSVHGRAAWPNPDACCSRNAFQEDAHSPSCPNWLRRTDEARPDDEPGAYEIDDGNGHTYRFSGRADEARAGEPRTPTGRELWLRLHGEEPGGTPHGGEIDDFILAIEREAAAAPVDVCNCPFLCCYSHE